MKIRLSNDEQKTEYSTIKEEKTLCVAQKKSKYRNKKLNLWQKGKYHGVQLEIQNYNGWNTVSTNPHIMQT